MSTALSTKRDIKSLINSDAMRQQFAAALPRHLTPDRFIRVATTALMRTPKLAQCSPESLMKCLLDLSSLGIEPDGRRAHLIPFENKKANTVECTLIIDWKGLAELAQRSGQIAKLHADLVCENDEFAYDLGEVLYHRIDFRKDRGVPYAAYAMAVTKDGAKYCAVMTRAEIYAIRDGSQGWFAFQKGWAKQSPWDPSNTGSEGEMWKKTAFRRLSKWLPLSPEFRDALDKDDDDEMRNVTPQVNLTPSVPTIEDKPQPLNPFAGGKLKQDVVDVAPEPGPEPQDEDTLC